MKKRIIQTIVAILLSSLFIFILLRLVDPAQIVMILCRIKPVWIIPALMVYFFSYIVRMFRFRLLLPSGRISNPGLLSIVLKHAFFLKIVPFKGGEFSFIYLLRKKGGVAYGHATSVLTVARLIDFVAMILFFLASLPFVTLAHHISRGFKISTIVFAMICLVSVLFLYPILNIFCKLLFGMVGRVRHRFKIRKLLLFGFSCRRGAALIGYGRLFAAFIMSMLTWSLLFICFWFLLFSIAMYVSPDYLLFISSAAIVASTIPVTLGTFGTFESGWVMTGVMAGFSTESAVTSGLYQNIMMLLFCFLFYLITLSGELLFKQLKKRIKKTVCD